MNIDWAKLLKSAGISAAAAVTMVFLNYVQATDIGAWDAMATVFLTAVYAQLSNLLPRGDG